MAATIILTDYKPFRDAMTVAEIETAARKTGFKGREAFRLAKMIAAFLERNNDWHEKKFGFRPELADYMSYFIEAPQDAIAHYLYAMKHEKEAQAAWDENEQKEAANE